MPARPDTVSEGAVSRLTSHLDVFWADRDGAIWSNWWNFGANNGRWNRSFPITPRGNTHPEAHVSACSRMNDHLDVFWVGNDGAIWTNWWNPGANRGLWNTPFTIAPAGSARAGSKVAAISRTSDHLDVFWVGNDNAVWTNWWNAHINRGRWNTPFRITPPNTAHPTSDVAVTARLSEHLDVFWVGNDGAIWTNWWDQFANNGGWPAPFRITPANAARSGGQISVVSRLDDHLDVFWVGNDGGIWTNWWNRHINNGGWNTAFRLTNPNVAHGSSGVAALARLEFHLDIFWVGPNGEIQSTWWDQNVNNGRWNTPFAVTGGNFARPNTQISPVARLDSHIDIFWRGSDGATWSAWWTHGGQWSGAFRISTIETINLHFKILTAPTSFTRDQMLDGMRQVYEPAGFRVEVGTVENLALPLLTDLDVGACNMGTTTAEQDTLFGNRNNVGANDIVVYFIRSTNPPFNGCAAHPANRPGCVVVQNASQWTLAHEVGHVLGLPHMDTPAARDFNRLMTGGGTGNITNPPPDLVQSELTTIRNSNLTV